MCFIVVCAEDIKMRFASLGRIEHLGIDQRTDL